MAFEDTHPTCYGLERADAPLQPWERERTEGVRTDAPPPPPGNITLVENAIDVLEDVMDPKKVARKAAFGLARMIRAKLR